MCKLYNATRQVALENTGKKINYFYVITFFSIIDSHLPVTSPGNAHVRLMRCISWNKLR